MKATPSSQVYSPQRLPVGDEPGQPLIQLRGVTKTFGSGVASFQALRGVDFEVRAGDFVAVMGPSGSGKSTMMNILGCLDVPTSGEFLFEGYHVEKLTRDEARVAAAALPRFRVPGLQPAGTDERARERRAAPAVSRREAAGPARGGDGRAGQGRPGRMVGPHARRAVGRAAAARRDRARHRHLAARAAGRRTDGQPRHARSRSRSWSC